jgi:threonyl-tRNA synthetase
MTEKNLETIRHSFAHVLAAAVYQMFPEAKFGIGPTIENGFYYDFELPRTLIPEDLEIIEGKMKNIIKAGIKFEGKEISVAEAKKFFQEAKQPYKIELIEDLAAEGKKEVKIYKSGDFVDLCFGPHVESTSELNAKAFQLTSIAGAYWRGNENNAMLQRIYGVAFVSEEDLKKYLAQEEEAKKRDHRLINKTMDLFEINDEVGAGFVILHPNGARIRHEIEKYWKDEHFKRGYDLVYTPHIGRIDLWKKSGHWDHYREMIYPSMKIDKEQFLLKPMNCPFHVMIYKSKLHSYKDLPIRLAEIGTVYRYEKAGVLHGLLRVRMITQDDAHIFCRPDQLEEEIAKVYDLAKEMLGKFGFEKFEIELALRDEANKKNYIGSEENWKKAEETLRAVLKKKSLSFKEEPGEAKFYGPAIDIKLLDALGRPWQGPTIQVDFNFPEKFDLNYIDEHGKKQRVVMIHRTVLGAIGERFIGNLIEHYGGLFPLWLAPEQVRILPISDKFNDYAQKVLDALVTDDIRAKIDDSNESLGKKIRNAELEKVPYMFIVGEKEKKAETISIRHHSKGDLGSKKLEEILKILVSEIKEKKIVK